MTTKKMQRIDLMTDLETLGTENNAPILSIGACKFDIETGNILELFYSVLGWHNALNEQPGRIACTRTVQWWKDQSEEARNAIMVHGQCDLKQVLLDYTNFIGPEHIFTWSNGSNFDIEILEHAFKQHKLDIPWKFWDIRDVRTITDVASHVYDKSSMKFQGTQHNALDDAVHQAKYVSKMWQRLKEINDEVPIHSTL